jgi:hypothetical protein
MSKQEKDLQQEIYQLQALVRVMADYIGGEFITTQFTNVEGQLRICTYSSSDESGKSSHARAVGRMISGLGVKVDATDATNEVVDP